MDVIRNEMKEFIKANWGYITAGFTGLSVICGAVWIIAVWVTKKDIESTHLDTLSKYVQTDSIQTKRFQDSVLFNIKFIKKTLVVQKSEQEKIKTEMTNGFFKIMSKEEMRDMFNRLYNNQELKKN